MTDGIGATYRSTTRSWGRTSRTRSRRSTRRTAAFTDDTGATDGLTVATGGYKVVFLAFPLEAFGGATDQAHLIDNTFTWFSTP